MKKALIITAIVVVVLVAAYCIRRATTQKFKVVKPLTLFEDSELKEPYEETLPIGFVLDKSAAGNGRISFEGNIGVITYNENGRTKYCYFDKSCVKPLIF